MKKFMILLLSLMLLLSFAACGDDTGAEETTARETTAEEKTTENTTEEPVEETTEPQEGLRPLSQAGLSEEALVQANRIHTLLYEYETVTVIIEGSYYYNETRFFNYDGGIVMTCAYTYEGETFYDGWIKGYEFIKTKDKVEAVINVENLNQQPEFPYQEFISNEFAGRNLAIEKETKEHYIVICNIDNGIENYVFRLYFNKSDLSLAKCERSMEDGSIYTITVLYDEKPDSFSEKLISDFTQGEKKTITLVLDMIVGDNSTSTKANFTVPYNWQVLPVSSEELSYYSNSESTQLYEYPGHSVDYTIYASNSLG